MWHEEKQFFWHQSEARTAATVWNWSGKTLSPGALLAVLYFSSFHIYFSACLDFPSSPLSAPRSPRMKTIEKRNTFTPQGKVSRMAPGAAGLDDAWAAGCNVTFAFLKQCF